jgi:ribosomal protein S6
MSDKNMPAVEATDVASYELAFHVLPTVAEGEVVAVFQTLKDIITTHGGELTLEEAPARFDLAYEIIRYLEGRNRKFTSAYFGWVRFTVVPSQIKEIDEEVTAVNELLRHILIKLTKNEEAHPFYFHEALEAETVSETIEVNEEAAVVAPVAEEKAAEKTEETDEKDGEEAGEKV